jgi:hypothetical protein
MAWGQECKYPPSFEIDVGIDAEGLVLLVAVLQNCSAPIVINNGAVLTFKDQVPYHCSMTYDKGIAYTFTPFIALPI